jgi:hypothetical protein
MKSKNIIVIVLVLMVLGLGYYSFQKRELPDSTQIPIEEDTKSYFVQNQECLMYKGTVANPTTYPHRKYTRKMVQYMY